MRINPALIKASSSADDVPHHYQFFVHYRNIRWHKEDGGAPKTLDEKSGKIDRPFICRFRPFISHFRAPLDNDSISVNAVDRPLIYRTRRSSWVASRSFPITRFRNFFRIARFHRGEQICNCKHDNSTKLVLTLTFYLLQPNLHD